MSERVYHPNLIRAENYLVFEDEAIINVLERIIFSLKCNFRSAELPSLLLPILWGEVWLPSEVLKGNTSHLKTRTVL